MRLDTFFFLFFRIGLKGVERDKKKATSFCFKAKHDGAPLGRPLPTCKMVALRYLWAEPEGFTAAEEAEARNQRVRKFSEVVVSSAFLWMSVPLDLRRKQI